MKPSKSIILALAIASLPAIIPAQTLGGAYLIDLKSGRTRQVAIASIGEIRKPLGLNFNLQVDGFAGIDAGVYPGVWISYSRPVAENVVFKFGPAFTFEDQRVRFPGFAVGFEFRL